jgi:putative transport protein
MEFIEQFVFGEGIAHSIFVLAVVIAIGTLLAKIKIGGISLGATWILFVGILASHFNMTLDAEMLKFVRDFGLTLFVFSIGLQIGPSFFSSLRHGGLRLMWLSILTMLFGGVVAYLLRPLCNTYESFFTEVLPKKVKKMANALAVGLSLVTCILVVYTLIIMVAPQLYGSVLSL